MKHICVIINIFLFILTACSNEGKIIKFDALTYQIRDNNAYVINQSTSSYYNTVTIHSNVSGYNVVGIDDFAFAEDIYLEKVTIEEGIRTIGKYAFKGCKNLKEVNLPESIKSINAGAFMSCKELNKLKLANGISEICDSVFFESGLHSIIFPKAIERIGKYAFYNNSLSSLCFSNNLKVIDDFAFANCSYISLVLPLSLEYLGEGAFQKQSPVGEIYIPDKLKYIGSAAFGMNSIDKFHVSSKNGLFTVKNGCLVSVADHRLIGISYEAIKNNVLTIPEGVEIIEKNGIFLDYHYGYKVHKIILPSSLKKISKESIFTYSQNFKLNTINIPASVECIEEESFYGDMPWICFMVDSNNKFFCSQDGILYDKKKSRLIQYPSMKQQTKFIVPKTVMNIDKCAFSDCKSLAYINLSNARADKQICASSNLISVIEYEGQDSILASPVTFGGNKKTLKFGKNVEYINSNVLSYNVSTILCPTEEPPFIDGDIPKNFHCVVAVPAESMYQYQCDEKWSQFAKFVSL